MLITDLHIKKDPSHNYCPTTLAGRTIMFVKNADGSVFVGPVWPGDSVFPDFTLTRARDWWGGLYKDFVAMGVGGFWNDMNEPSVFLNAPTRPCRSILSTAWTTAPRRDHRADPQCVRDGKRACALTTGCVNCSLTSGRSY